MCSNRPLFCTGQYSVQCAHTTLVVWCLGPDSNRHGISPNGFSYHFGFHRRANCAFVVWNAPQPWQRCEHCFRPPSSTLYTVPMDMHGAWLGVASTQASGGSPTLAGFTADVSVPRRFGSIASDLSRCSHSVSLRLHPRGI